MVILVLVEMRLAVVVVLVLVEKAFEEVPFETRASSVQVTPVHYFAVGLDTDSPLDTDLPLDTDPPLDIDPPLGIGPRLASAFVQEHTPPLPVAVATHTTPPIASSPAC